MLGENIKILRKSKGLSQETLAEQLHIVRQTVSKWEVGQSVPDAEMLNKISELFEVPVSELLGSRIPEHEEQNQINEITKQLAILNEHLANTAARRRKTIKKAFIGITIALFLMFSVTAFMSTLYSFQTGNNTLSTTSLDCTLKGETYHYEVTYNQLYHIIEAGGDGWIADHMQIEKYNDANILITQIEDYFTDQGGTVQLQKIVDNTLLN